MKYYFDEVYKALKTIDTTQTDKLVYGLVNTWKYGHTVFVIGNGGSAATASHLACDVSKLTIVEGTPRFKILALTDNMPIITAWANDTSYSNVFVQQLIPFITDKDFVLGISGSGNSKNVLNAFEYAKSIGAKTACLSGFEGGLAKSVVDVSVVTYSDNMQVIEDCHSILCHAISLKILRIAERFATTGKWISDEEVQLRV
ncbi:SIS domain-containing protein [Cohnella caldifontis]|uniref:SIS domain-containing protein n=1 Tax=Cohnella caldifontis TaxID=3027471 RepID=UPI0023EC5036|nr:SIS domain-containing protein [Cohnella sp. YIM B05605]